MSREQLIAALQGLVPTATSTEAAIVHALAEGWLLGFLLKEGYDDVFIAYENARAIWKDR